MSFVLEVLALQLLFSPLPKKLKRRSCLSVALMFNVLLPALDCWKESYLSCNYINVNSVLVFEFETQYHVDEKVIKF